MFKVVLLAVTGIIIMLWLSENEDLSNKNDRK